MGFVDDPAGAVAGFSAASENADVVAVGNAEQLLLGVDIGGLGTLIASLASLISFKLYGATAGAKKGRYFAEFSAYNFAMLIVLFAAQTGFNALSA